MLRLYGAHEAPFFVFQYPKFNLTKTQGENLLENTENTEAENKNKREKIVVVDDRHRRFRTVNSADFSSQEDTDETEE